MPGSVGCDCGTLSDVMVASSGPNFAIHPTSINSRARSGHDSNSAFNASANAALSSGGSPA